MTPEFINPQQSLYKIPRFQGQLKSPFARILGTTLTDALCSLAFSTWRLVGNSDCDVVKKETTKETLVQIGTARSIEFSFCGDVFGHWIGTTTEKAASPNYLGILAIGWSYILSAQLVEMQGGSASMCYTDSRADCLDESHYNPSEDVHFVDVGEVDERVARWWTALLAKCEGWKAIVKSDPDDEFVAPWSVFRTCETPFFVKRRKRDSLSPVQMPLSSDDAFDALLQFARSHDLGSQFPISLTIAMSFPMHRYYGIDIKLPQPRAYGGKTPTTALDGSPVWMELKKDLPYYMTLSCSPEVMISTLCGSFWQPDVPCNMVSQWLHPVEEVLCDVTEGKDQELIALIGATRRPSLGALWIGAAVSGIIPKLFAKVREGRPPLDSHGFPWTGAPQSFMDDAGAGPYTRDDSKYISRPDVWRLLNLSPIEEDDLSYENRPMTPWEPCGVCLTTNCALRVTSHLDCPRHEYHYDHWNWELENGEKVRDGGFLQRYPLLSTTELCNIPNGKVASHSFKKKELDPNRQASEEASIDIFFWLIIGGDGIPPEKIYHNGLLCEVLEQNNDDNADEPLEADHQNSQEPALKNKDRFESWLDTIG